jgi:glycosyltransferase involved in cell wall biosynthesis
VYYAPVNEDYGLVPYEAFLSDKPVITTTDAGGPLDIVHDGRTGRVVAPTREELARALAFTDDEAQRMGRAGHELASAVTWQHCVERLLEVAA